MPTPEELQQDGEFMSATPADQARYLHASDPDFHAASAEDQAAYLAHVTKQPTGGESEAPSKWFTSASDVASKVSDAIGSGFKGLAALAPSMGGSHIAQGTGMGESGKYNPKQGEQAVETSNKMAQTGAEFGKEAAAGLLKQPLTAGGSRIANPPKEVPSPETTGVAKALGGTVGGMAADPRMWALAALPGEQAGPLLSRLISGGFSAQLGAGAAEGAVDLQQNWDTMNQEQRAEAITNLGIGTALTALTAGHTVHGLPEEIPGALTEGVRLGGRIGQKVGPHVPTAAAALGATHGLTTGGVPSAYFEGKGAGYASKYLAEPIERASNAMATFKMSPEDRNVELLGVDKDRADKAHAKALADHSKYVASEAKGPIDPETNPAYKKSSDAVKRAQDAAAEAHYHWQEAKEAAEAARAAKAAEVPEHEITPEVVAAARPIPTSAPAPVEEPLETPSPFTGMRKLGPTGEAGVMGKPLALPEHATETAPAPPEAPPEPAIRPLASPAPATAAEMAGLKAVGGRVVEAPEKAVGPLIKQGLAEGSKAAKPAVEAPVEAPKDTQKAAEAPKEAPKTEEAPKAEPGLLGTEKELKNEGRSPEDLTKVDTVVKELPNQDLIRHGARFGVDESKYDFSKREAIREGGSKHPIEREAHANATVNALPEALKNQIVDAANAWDAKDTSVFDQASRSNASRAERARAIMNEAMTRYQDELAAKGASGGSEAPNKEVTEHPEWVHRVRDAQDAEEGLGIPKAHPESHGQVSDAAHPEWANPETGRGMVEDKLSGRGVGRPQQETRIDMNAVRRDKVPYTINASFTPPEGAAPETRYDFPKGLPEKYVHVKPEGGWPEEKAKAYKDMTPAEQEALAAKGQAGGSGKEEVKANAEGVGGIERWQGKNPLDKASVRPTQERVNLPADTGKPEEFKAENQTWEEQLREARKAVNKAKAEPTKESPKPTMNTARMSSDELLKQGFTQKQIDEGKHLPTVSGGAPSTDFKDWFGKSKVVDKDGKPLRVYHGTRSSTDFDIDFSTEGPPTNEEGETSTSGSGPDPTAYMGAHFAVEPEVANKFAEGKSGWLRSRFESGEEKPRVIPTYLKLENPKDFGSEENLRDYIYQGNLEGYAGEIALEAAARADGIEPETPEADKWNEKYDSDPKFRAKQNHWVFENYSPEGDEDTTLHEVAQDMAMQAKSRLEKEGYDGAKYKNEVEGGNAFLAFHPEQILSSISGKKEVTFDPERFRTQTGEDTELKPLAAKKKAPLGKAKK